MNKILDKLKKLAKAIIGAKTTVRSDKNPWAGLYSYEDPIKLDNPLKFCGREEEISDLFNLIDNNLVVTLYGKSGIGKTSLLNAGVFPILRENNYAPLYVRFGTDDNLNEVPFAKHIVNSLTEYFIDSYGKNSIETIDVIPQNSNPESEEYLWAFFARTHFTGPNGQQIFPVIVLDQFEENIRFNRGQSSLLLKQIKYMASRQNMLKDTIVDGQHYEYNYNFRFIISIREDDLFRLEDIINTNYLSSLKECRYRLQNLNQESATAIVEKVGIHCIAPEESEQISKIIINAAKDKDGLIQTNVISLVCSRLFDLATAKGKDIVTLQDTEQYLSCEPFEEYYASAIKSLTEGEKRFIEEHLVTDDGRRAMIPESHINESIKSYNTLIKGGTPIFRRLKSSSGDCLIELIHDGLCQIVTKHRAIRLERKNKTILSLCLLIAVITGLWLLNKTIVNDFVSFFLALSFIPSKGLSALNFCNVLSIAELANIILWPVAIGSIVYDYKKKRNVALSLSIIYLIPIILFPKVFINIFESNLLHEVAYLKEFDFSKAIGYLSDRTIVFAIYTIILLGLCYLNFFGKSGINRQDGLWKMLWNSFSAKLYILIIAFFLFYKSIFNTGYFIIDSYDSSWGLVIIPLLSLCVFGFNLKGKSKKVAFCLYAVLLFILMTSSIFELFIQSGFQLIIILATLPLTLLLSYKGRVPNAFFKSLCNTFLLAVIIFIQNGYNPLSITNKTIYKVYPWKIVVSVENNQYGVYDAVYGDTIVPPEFQKDSISKFDYYTYVSGNSYIDTISRYNVGDADIPFPLKLTKGDTGKWKLSLRFSPNYEQAISSLAHSKNIDSTMISDKIGADLFLKLRRDISMFCITGNDSIILSNIPSIISYEEAIKHDLKKAILQMQTNDSIMTEAIIVPFVKALSRALYMNMLKESILKAYYNEFIGLYSNYYIAASLTEITAKNGIKWSNSSNYNWNLDLNTNGENSYTSNQSGVITATLDGLNSNRVYSWNNLYYALFLLECNAYAPTYYSGIERKLEGDKTLIENLYKNCLDIKASLTNYTSVLSNQNNRLNRVLDNLTNIRNNGDTLSTDNVMETISAVLEVNGISQNVKSNISKVMDSYGVNVKGLTDSLKEVALQQANIQFENIVTETFNSLLDIIKKNPNNAYNGLLISLCQKLYVIGIIRGYDMGAFTTQMDKIEGAGTLPMYTFVRQVDNQVKNRSLLIDSLKNIVNINNLKARQVIELINQN